MFLKVFYKKKKIRSSGSALENKFHDLWVKNKGPKLDREFLFYGDKKNKEKYKKEFGATTIKPWRFDFAIKRKRVAIEIEGSHRHYTLAGYRSDCVKYNQAHKHDWIVYRLTPCMINQGYVSHLVDAVKRHRRR